MTVHKVTPLISERNVNLEKASVCRNTSVVAVLRILEALDPYFARISNWLALLVSH